MEKINHIVEALTKEHGLLSYLSFIPIALFTFRKKKTPFEPEFLGDNAPYTIIDKLKKRG